MGLVGDGVSGRHCMSYALTHSELIFVGSTSPLEASLPV